MIAEADLIYPTRKKERPWSGRWTGSMYQIWDYLIYLSAQARLKGQVRIHPSYAQIRKFTGWSKRTIGRAMQRFEELGYIKRWKQYFIWTGENKDVKTWLPREVFISRKGYSYLNAKIADLLSRYRRAKATAKEPLSPKAKEWWFKLFRQAPPKIQRYALPPDPDSPPGEIDFAALKAKLSS